MPCWTIALKWTPKPEVESSRTHFEVLGLGLEGQVLGLEASSPQNWPVLGSRTALFFELLKVCGALETFFGKRFFVEIAWKIFVKTFFFGKHLRLCPWPWPRAFLSLASRVSVLGEAVLDLGLGFFFVSLASSLVFSTPPLPKIMRWILTMKWYHRKVE